MHLIAKYRLAWSSLITHISRPRLRLNAISARWQPPSRVALHLRRVNKIKNALEEALRSPVEPAKILREDFTQVLLFVGRPPACLASTAALIISRGITWVPMYRFGASTAKRMS
jgi:hypothetical protein